MKVCSNPKCHRKGKPQMESNFYIRTDRWAYVSRCKDCQREKSRKYYYNHTEQCIESTKKWKGENPENNIKHTRRYRKKFGERDNKNKKKRYEEDLDYRKKIKKGSLNCYHKNKIENRERRNKKQRERYNNNLKENRRKARERYHKTKAKSQIDTHPKSPKN